MFLQLVLDASEDPDVAQGSFACGVRVGPGPRARLPRLPALHAFLDYAEDKAQGVGIWRRNDASFAGLSHKVLEVRASPHLRERKGASPWANHCFTWCASHVESSQQEYCSTVCNGSRSSSRTWVRDQERAPMARRLEESHAQGGNHTFALTADIAEARSQSRSVTGTSLDARSYINTVGTFGVASASYYWSRMTAAIGRISQYLVGDRAQTWHMLVADDYHLESGCEEYRSGVLHPLRNGWRATFLEQDSWGRCGIVGTTDQGDVTSSARER